MTQFRNTDILARLSEVLTDRYDRFGTDQAVVIELYEKDGLLNSFLRFLGLAEKEKLTVRFSKETGYTLEGPGWRQIKRKLGCSAKEFGQRIISELQDVWESTYGWERSLIEDLEGLDEL